MKIQTFKRDEYRKCPIYYRNFLDHFEYLVIINGELYTTFITVTPFWATKLFYWLGIETKPYTDNHLKAILTQLRRMAETTIETVLLNNK